MSDEYINAVDADSPVAHYRLDMEGSATDGDTIPDLVGGFDGQLFYINPEGGLVPYGHQSPIETDPASRSFEFRIQPFSTVDGSQNASFVEVGDDPALQLDDFALGLWFQPFDNSEYSMSAGVRYRLAGKGADYFVGYTLASPTGTPGEWLARFVAGVTLSDNTIHYAEASDFVPIVGTFYDLVGVRSGTSLGLYVNKQLRALESIPALATRQSGANFLIGLNGIRDGAGYLDEVRIFSSLAGARVGAQYDAARIRAAISGRSDARPTATLSSLREPAPLTLSVRHNWNELFVERLTWANGIAQARAGAEEAAGANLTPRRELEYSPLLRDDRERRRFHARTHAGQGRRFYCPYEPDKTQVQAALSAGATSIPADTRYRNYEIGGFANVYQLGDDGVIEKEEVRTVTSLSTSAVGVDALENSYDAFRTFVRPALRGYLPKSISLRGHAASVEDLTLQVRLLAEDEPVAPRRIVEWAPTLSYKGYEVFDPAEWQSNDWTEPREYELEREAEDVDSGRGVFSVFSDTPNAQGAFTYRMALEGREYIARLLGWFYARAGRRNYLWVPTMQSDLEIVSAASDDLTVYGHDYTENHSGLESRQDIAFVYHDNSMTLRRISSAVASGSNDLLDLDAAVPALTNLRSVSYLKFCRLDADAVEMAWHSDSVVVFAWRFRELITAPD